MRRRKPRRCTLSPRGPARLAAQPCAHRLTLGCHGCKQKRRRPARDDSGLRGLPPSLQRLSKSKGGRTARGGAGGGSTFDYKGFDYKGAGAAGEAVAAAAVGGEMRTRAREALCQALCSPLDEPAGKRSAGGDGPAVAVEFEVSGCPNRASPHHVCSAHCRRQWGGGQLGGGAAAAASVAATTSPPVEARVLVTSEAEAEGGGGGDEKDEAVEAAEFARALDDAGAVGQPDGVAAAAAGAAERARAALVAAEVENALHRHALTTGASTQAAAAHYKTGVRSVCFNLAAPDSSDFRRALLHAPDIAAAAEAIPALAEQGCEAFHSEAFRAALTDIDAQAVAAATFQQGVGMGEAGGLFTCASCGSNKTAHRQAQLMRGDEPMTTFVACFGCGDHWALDKGF